MFHQNFLHENFWFKSIPEKMFFNQRILEQTFLVQTYSRGNDFATIKLFHQKFLHFSKKNIFNQNFLMKIVGSNLFLRKLFCNQKKIFDKKCSMKIFYSNLLTRKWFCNHKIFDQKIFHENYWKKPIPQEMTLQH